MTRRRKKPKPPSLSSNLEAQILERNFRWRWRRCRFLLYRRTRGGRGFGRRRRFDGGCGGCGRGASRGRRLTIRRLSCVQRLASVRAGRLLRSRLAAAFGWRSRLRIIVVRGGTPRADRSRRPVDGRSSFDRRGPGRCRRRSRPTAASRGDESRQHGRVLAARCVMLPQEIDEFSLPAAFGQAGDSLVTHRTAGLEHLGRGLALVQIDSFGLVARRRGGRRTAGRCARLRIRTRYDQYGQAENER